MTEGIPMRSGARTFLVVAALAAACDRPDPIAQRWALSANNVMMEVTGDVAPRYPLVAIATEPGQPPPNVSVDYGGEWLSAEVLYGGGGPPYWFDLSPKTAAFTAPGYHTSILTVSAPGFETRWVTVNTLVTAPTFEPSTAHVRFQMAPGGEVPAPRSVTVARASGASGIAVPDPVVTLHGETCGEWVEAAVTASGAGYALTLTPVAWAVSGLASGTTCRVSVVLTFTFEPPPGGGAGTTSSTSISATLVVQSPVSPLLEVSQSPLRALSFSALAGRGVSSQRVTVADALGGALAPPPPVSTSAAWLSAAVSGTRAPYVITVSPRSWDLPPGSYLGEVTVGAPGSPSSDRVGVALDVQGWTRTAWTNPGLGVSASEVFDGRLLLAGGTGPAWLRGRDPGFRVCEGGALRCVASEFGEAVYADGTMLTPRSRHTATVYADRHVLAAGGLDPETRLPVATWEIYEHPSAWYVERPLATPRFAHTATLLEDGTVLVAGGAVGAESDPIAIADAEVLDPGGVGEAGGNHVYAWGANGWRIAPMSTPRRDASAVRLPDGRVLVAGGQVVAGAALASAELFDPVSGTWSATESMNEPRADAALVLLDDGRVLAAGGTDGQRALATAELYDPATGTWSYTGSLALGRVAPAVRLSDGKVLLVAGLTGQIGARVVTGTVERYDPATETWSPAASLHEPRTGHAVTLLQSSGLVVVAGGTSELPWSDGTLVWGVEVGTGWAP
jgi:hypothetical protein